jgi:hypothetical protein
VRKAKVIENNTLGRLLTLGSAWFSPQVELPDQYFTAQLPKPVLKASYMGLVYGMKTPRSNRNTEIIRIRNAKAPRRTALGLLNLKSGSVLLFHRATL